MTKKAKKPDLTKITEEQAHEEFAKLLAQIIQLCSSDIQRHAMQHFINSPLEKEVQYKLAIHSLSENKDNLYLQKIRELEDELRSLKKSKRYGLVWEDKPEDVAERCKNELPVLLEDSSKRIIEN